MHRFMPFVSILLFFLGCSAGEPPDPGGAATGGPPSSERERVIHVTSRVSVADLRASTSALRGLTEDAGGYIVTSHIDGDRVSLDLAIPAASLGVLRARLDALDPERTEFETSEDVTEAHADLGARLLSAQRTEARLLELLADRTASLSDVLSAEHELERIRERIETLSAEERTMASRIAMAQVHLVLELRHASLVDAPLAAITESFSFGLDATYAVMLAGAVVGSALLPGGAILLALLLALRWGYRFLMPRLG